MRVLLNFFPVQSGGGQQVAINFLKAIAKNNFGHKWFMYVGKNSEIHNLSKEQFLDERIFSTYYSYISRIKNKKLLNEYIKDNNIDIIYNYAPVLPIKGIPQVIRTVYSNLYFPEIDFWSSYPLHIRILKKIKDYYRLKGTLKANGLIFENLSMQKRAINLFSYPIENTIYIEPSVTDFDETNSNYAYDFIDDINCFKVLYLSSWHLNKNITLLPLVAYLLKNEGYCVKFILSLNSEDVSVQKNLITQINKYGVENSFIFLGKVNSIYVHQVIKSSHAMILLSKLECFSSNVVEAFYFKKPLIISNELWARTACKDAALYVDRDNGISVKNAIIELINNNKRYIDLITKGNERLKSFNTPFNKVKKQVEFLEKIYEKNKDNT